MTLPELYSEIGDLGAGSSRSGAESSSLWTEDVEPQASVDITEEIGEDPRPARREVGIQADSSASEWRPLLSPHVVACLVADMMGGLLIDPSATRSMCGRSINDPLRPFG